MALKDEFAIIGATASGKSSLAIELAVKLGGVILSLDTLSVYKEIDIASAKPTQNELRAVKHFGVDLVYPNDYFSVIEFIEVYKEAKEFAKESKKPLIITGGSSFYLKMLIEGLSPLPKITDSVKDRVKGILEDIKSAYNLLLKLDPHFKVNPNDSYRIGRALEIYFATDTEPSKYFLQNPPTPIIKDIPIYEIIWDRELLRERIRKRTHKMVEMGLIDEVAVLEAKYRDRGLTSLKAIGIREVLDYFDGLYSKEQTIEKIITNTTKLAKRQTTFNGGQFKTVKGDIKSLKEKILKYHS